MIRAVIFDVSGVLLHLPHQVLQQSWEQLFHLAPGAIGQALWGSDIGRDATLGRATPEAVWHALGQKLGLSRAQLIEMEQTYLAAEYLDADMAALLRHLRQRYRLALLTNAWIGTRQVLTERFALAALVDDIIISAEVGLAKPDPAIYRLTLGRLGAVSGETLFIDDKERNTGAAEALGMRTVLFRDTAQAIAAIQRHLQRDALAEMESPPPG